MEGEKAALLEVRREVAVLENQGHKRVLLVYGEMHGIDYVADTIAAVYDTRVGRGEIRRANVNLAPLTVADFKVLKSTGIGTYQCFQETYHRETYRKMHPTGAKSVYEWRLFALDRAQQGLSSQHAELDVLLLVGDGGDVGGHDGDATGRIGRFDVLGVDRPNRRRQPIEPRFGGDLRHRGGILPPLYFFYILWPL